MTPHAPAGYAVWLDSLKEKIRNARLKAGLSVNRELILLYWRIGKEILARRETQGWGSKIVEQLAKDLRAEFPDMRGLSRSNLMYMRAFAEAWPDEAIVQQAAGQLPWFHNCVILDKIKDRALREWYIKKAIENGWSRSVLELQIETQIHTRIGSAQHNFERTLPALQSDLARDIVKDPYSFDFLGITGAANERAIEKGLVTHLRDFLIELGTGFAFVGSQYKLDVDGDEYFIDLLFYHLRLHCYIVIELKNTAFKPEYAGKLNFYLAVADDKLRDPVRDTPAIGLILCKSKKSTTVEYAMKNVNSPMGVSTYRTSPELPKDVAGLLPSIESLEAQLQVEWGSENTLQN